MVKPRKKSPIVALTIDHYFSLLIRSLVKPSSFHQLDVAKGNGLSAMLYLGLSSLLASMIWISLQAYQTHRISLFFLGISQSILYTPFYVLLALVIATILTMLAKPLGGYGSIWATFKAVCFSSGPLVFIAIPWLNILCGLIALNLLLINIEHTQDFSYIKSLSVVVIPLLIALFLKIVFFP